MKKYQEVAVGGFILNDKKEVLLVKRSETDDFLPRLWELPGGGLDFGENPTTGVQRELQEEVGLDIEVGRPLSVDNYFMEKGEEKIHRVEISFLCTMTKPSQQVVLSHEHSEYTWLSKENLKEIEMTDYMNGIVKNCFDNM
ncbi:MAG TPA: NUDIX hydrolase [Candidatus Eisenbacteria bacterium]|nr:NUDIX hydrolase [Candidatus Eisenbacteria bacterium]